ncbi:T9SS type A sorting domain-containing protein [Polaribacter sargassicola]|uniref:T9SS type A sorting domain-containing protein n=1 Tax=Polaribacter sargassicola TaxID=2836891 RepID=UPI001F16FA8C|nr:T9SS type A sorting domain-containing protein [Polaribacter sp. DS7-9]MCG1037382.1 T9SS type A sorting domain-containing protein [Polaribacter sp. DS7-9]
MKTKLLFEKKTKTFLSLFLLCFCFNYGWSQTNLVLNGTADLHVFDSNDNADAWDMTPPSSIDDNLDSPYRALWYNSDLDSWLEGFYSDDSEQPGASSDGSYVNGEKTRGVKLSENSRRLYQVVTVVPGLEYTFKIDSRSEEENINSEIFILNEEITSEEGLDSSSSSVDAYLEVTNDYNPSKGSADVNTFTTNTITFTASKSKVVIYVRSLSSVDSSHEVFYDNIELFDASTASVDDVFSSKISIYPNPANDFVKISTLETIDTVDVYNLIGKKVISSKNLIENSVDISTLAKGVYMLKITSGNSVASKKLIKK